MHFAPTYDDMTPGAKLRAFWEDFCDAVGFVPPEFLENMEEAGFVAVRAVTEADIEDDPFAYERGIVLGGTMWELTEAGTKALKP